MHPSSSNHSAFLTRITLGSILLAHGLLKVFFFTIPVTISFFDSLGLPPVAAHLTIFGEIVVGTALILGIYPCLATILSLPILIGVA